MAASAAANAPHTTAQPQPQPRPPIPNTTAKPNCPPSHKPAQSAAADPSHALQQSTASGIEASCTSSQHAAQELGQSREAAAATPSTTATAAAPCAAATAEANSHSATAPGNKQHAAQQTAGPQPNAAAQQQGCDDEAERHEAGLCPVGITTYTEVSHR